MIDFLTAALSFVVALSVLIAVHEFGHFWVARRLGVKVLRYSIGFGKPLWLRRAGPDQTEYVIAAVPLGGYVKMLDEREGEVAAEELGRAFNRQPVAKRFAIVAAGPLFNLGFAVLAYWLMFIVGLPGLKPILGEISPESLAYQAGLRSQQQIVAVGETPTPTWGAALDTLLPYVLRKEPVMLAVNDGGAEYRYLLPLDRLTGEPDPVGMGKALGLKPYHPPVAPVVDVVEPDSPAARAGLRSRDEVVAINSAAVIDWESMVATVQAHPDEVLRFTIRRDGAMLELDIRPARIEAKDGKSYGRIGAGPYLDEATEERLRGVWRLGVLAAVPAAVAKTYDMSALTLRMMGEMVLGRASVENISGPITIAIYAKSSALAGFAQFLGFLAIVSVSLGVLNLLPIPILDGGHLLFYVVELIKGRAVSERTEAVAQKIGMTLILLLMTVAFYNDFVRLLGGK